LKAGYIEAVRIPYVNIGITTIEYFSLVSMTPYALPVKANGTPAQAG
jgi:hypothetical protein